MKKTAVIFDMDGLMFDTQCIYNKSYDEIAMSLYGFKVPPDMYLALMGSSALYAGRCGRKKVYKAEF